MIRMKRDHNGPALVIMNIRYRLIHGCHYRAQDGVSYRTDVEDGDKMMIK